MQVEIKSTFAISLPEEFRRAFMSDGPLIMDLEAGERLVDLLRRLPSIGPE